MIAPLERIIKTSSNEVVRRYIDGTLSELHDTVIEYVPSSALSNFSNLETVEFQAASEIGNRAFYNCINLKNASFPNCTSIGNSAFYSANLSGSINFQNVQEINEYAFCRGYFSEFSAPRCTKIEHDAFGLCYNLKSVSFPKLSDLSYCIFKDCYQLNRADFEGMAVINNASGAFANCYSLSILTFPNLKTINYASGMFSNCSIASISMPLLEEINCSDIFRYASYITELYLPKCTSIRTNAFNGAPIGKLSMPKLTIGNGYADMFQSASIRELDLGIRESIVIGNNFFKDCYFLSKINNIEYWGILSIGNSAFYNCQQLRNIRLDICTNIGSYAFERCMSLTTMNLPSCSKVGSEAFAYCYSLRTFNASMLRSVQDSTFLSCSSLKTVSVMECTTIGPMAFKSCSELEIVYAPKCSMLGSEVFRGCLKLKEFDMSALKTIGSRAFYSCSTIKTANLYNCETIYPGAFRGCTNLEEVIVSKHISMPGFEVSNWEQIFSECTNLTTLRLNGYSNFSNYDKQAFLEPGHVKTLELNDCIMVEGFDSIFTNSYYTSLENLYLNNCKYIGDYAFYNDDVPIENLKSLDLPECSYIGRYGLADAKFVTDFTLPKIECIEEMAFARATNDEALYQRLPSRTFLLTGSSVADIKYSREFCDWLLGVKQTWDNVGIIVPKELYSAYMERYSGCGFASRIMMAGNDNK